MNTTRLSSHASRSVCTAFADGSDSSGSARHPDHVGHVDHSEQATAPSTPKQGPSNTFKPRRSRWAAGLASVAVSVTILGSVVGGFGAQADAALQLAQPGPGAVATTRA